MSPFKPVCEIYLPLLASTPLPSYITPMCLFLSVLTPVAAVNTETRFYLQGNATNPELVKDFWGFWAFLKDFDLVCFIFNYCRQILVTCKNKELYIKQSAKLQKSYISVGDLLFYQHNFFFIHSAKTVCEERKSLFTFVASMKSEVYRFFHSAKEQKKPETGSEGRLFSFLAEQHCHLQPIQVN